jgi:fructosamine-3-kinase
MSLAQHAAALLGREPVKLERLAGGDLSEVLRLRFADGDTAIVKGGPSPAAEAAMLAAIRDSGAPAPTVLAHDARVLVLEELPAQDGPERAWRDLGRVLGALHGVRGAAYGWDVDYAFGDVAIRNAWAASWTSFWAERRLVGHVPHLPRDLGRRVETLARDLANRLPDRPEPSLLHGDLWSGNILVSGSRVTGLIDPACCFGDREVDFAMLCLFARPDAELFGSLDHGAAARRPIYQLWPALVHLRLFGAGYRPLVERLLAAVGC